MNAETAKKLRDPFPAGEVGKLPRITCKQCRDSSTKVCGQHQKSRCATCGNQITSAHIHLDYVGHAAVTDRLLQVDPEWTWEPMATNGDGFPVFDAQGGLWIRLTVAGVTRPGYGDPGKIGPKEAIGDALRNAAMRFGVGLDLWSKEDLHASQETDEKPAPEPAEPMATEEEVAEIRAAALAAGYDEEMVMQAVVAERNANGGRVRKSWVDVQRQALSVANTAQEVPA